MGAALMAKFKQWRNGTLSVLLGLIVGAPLAVLPSTAAHASACYDGAVVSNFYGDDGIVTIPAGGGYYTTSNRCADINFKWYSTSQLNLQANVRVCWVNSGTCNSWKWYDAGYDSWKVIASGVLDGTKFRVQMTNFPGPTWGTHYGVKIAS
jgi:hypothetical protein